jgi:hypothetical protein
MRARKFADPNPVIKAAPVSCLSDMKAGQANKIGQLREVLVTAGFDTLCKQAEVLGLSASTAWEVMRGGHKASGLSAVTIKRILASPDLPPAARRVIDEYIFEKVLGRYGHTASSLRRFRDRLGYPFQSQQPAQKEVGILRRSSTG